MNDFQSGNMGMDITAFAQTHCHLLIVPVVLLFFVYIVYKDYHSFLSLGPGGTPYNFYGYCIITGLRIIALRNTRVAAPVPAEFTGTGYFEDIKELPKRKGSRPNVIGIAPHRQTNQKASDAMFDRISTHFKGLAVKYPKLLGIATSCFEKHTTGLFSKKVVNKTCGGEITHCHPSDGSMHMTLHPEDCEKIISAGYGERHPLARGGWCRRFVPETFLMIYAPVNEEEFEMVQKIIQAGIFWVSGLRMNQGDLDMFTEEASGKEADVKAQEACDHAATIERKESCVSEAGDLLMDAA